MAGRRHGRCVVETSNEDKVLFPRDGITKGALIDYYERVADRILPHLRARPLVVQRFPDGIGAPGFYQKQVSGHLPDWITTARVRLRGAGGTQELAVCDRKATLAWLANQACITLHPWLSRADRPNRPDLLVVDLDPPGDAFEPARHAALWVRALFDDLGLPSFPKLTGSRGVHVVVPLDRRADFDAVRAFARDAMALLAARHPDAVTLMQRKAKRRGRLYLDVGRNAWAQTAVAPYAVRALPGAPVAVPLAWEELERKGIGARDYSVRNVFRRLAQHEDPWAGMRRHASSLDAARRRLDRLRDAARLARRSSRPMDT
jgi:bifunctional non-homologous end joining protein LigD